MQVLYNRFGIWYKPYMDEPLQKTERKEIRLTNQQFKDLKAIALLAGTTASDWIRAQIDAQSRKLRANTDLGEDSE